MKFFWRERVIGERGVILPPLKKSKKISQKYLDKYKNHAIMYSERLLNKSFNYQSKQHQKGESDMYTIILITAITSWFLYGVATFTKGRITKVDFSLVWGTLILMLAIKLAEMLKFTP